MRYANKFERELKFWNSEPGIELSLCLASQGYYNLLCNKLMYIYGFEGWIVAEALRELNGFLKEVKGGKNK
jgi:hypothetical protein